MESQVSNQRQSARRRQESAIGIENGKNGNAFTADKLALVIFINRITNRDTLLHGNFVLLIASTTMNLYNFMLGEDLVEQLWYTLYICFSDALTGSSKHPTGISDSIFTMA